MATFYCFGSDLLGAKRAAFCANRRRIDWGRLNRTGSVIQHVDFWLDGEVGTALRARQGLANRRIGRSEARATMWALNYGCHCKSRFQSQAQNVDNHPARAADMAILKDSRGLGCIVMFVACATLTAGSTLKFELEFTDSGSREQAIARSLTEQATALHRPRFIDRASSIEHQRSSIIDRAISTEQYRPSNIDRATSTEQHRVGLGRRTLRVTGHA